MRWPFRRNRPPGRVPTPRRHWARLPVLGTTVALRPPLLSPLHRPPPVTGATPLVPDAAVTVLLFPERRGGAHRGRMNGLVRLIEPLEEPPSGEVGETVGPAVTAGETFEPEPPPPVRRRASPAPAPAPRPVLTKVTEESVGEPTEPVQPFRSITEVERLFAEYEANDVAGLAALTGFSSVTGPPTTVPEPPRPEVRRLRRPTLGQTRRLARASSAGEPGAPASEKGTASVQNRGPAEPPMVPGEVPEPVVFEHEPPATQDPGFAVPVEIAGDFAVPPEVVSHPDAGPAVPESSGWVEPVAGPVSDTPVPVEAASVLAVPPEVVSRPVAGPVIPERPGRAEPVAGSDSGIAVPIETTSVLATPTEAASDVAPDPASSLPVETESPKYGDTAKEASTSEFVLPEPIPQADMPHPAVTTRKSLVHEEVSPHVYRAAIASLTSPVPLIEADHPERSTLQVPETIADSFRAQFGVDVADVPVRRGKTVSAQAAAISARAFTTGGEVFLPDEAGALDTVNARGLLVHELTHVAQQRMLGAAMPPEVSADGAELERRALEAERWARGENTAPEALVHRQVAAGAPQAAPPEVVRAEEKAPDGVAPVQAEPEQGLSWSIDDTFPDRAVAPEPAAPERSDADLLTRLDRMDAAITRLDERDREVPARENPDLLADRLYHRLRHRLRGELLVDRERRGTLADRW
ncbi:DUF4157 domain-containing protein [Amycolatopsis sp. lyj-84]|uniref:eCIS core domain-containing protein n=1 Tax=Amycolatopsis sp. lyj-84 TaxID=2789284 RepID=UPI00397C5E39